MPARSDEPALIFRRSNLVAGIAGYGWNALLQLLATPVLIALLGAESFGVIGFYMAVQGVSQVLDLGLSPTINREMARAGAAARPDDAHDFLRTIERGYWLLGAAIGLVIAALAPLLASRWAVTSGLAEGALRQDVLLIAALVAAQWPITLYEGALTGLGRLTVLHAAGIVMRTAGVGTGLLLLWLGPRELPVYLTAMTVASVLHALLLARLVRRALPRATRAARHDAAVVWRVWRFAAAMSVLMVLSAVLIHADKLLLSRLLPLREFGYYTLASLLASGLYVLFMPVFHVLFPVLSGRVAAGDAVGERDAYHLGAQSLAVLGLPAGAVMAFFAAPLLRAWTGSAETAAAVAPIARLLVIGTALNGLMSAPYALQVARGRPKLGVWIHVALIAVFLPAIVMATSAYGPLGAAAVWVGLNVLFIVVGVAVTHHALMPGASRTWLGADVLPAGAVGAAVAYLGWRAASTTALPAPVMVGCALLTLMLAWSAAALAAGRVRRWVLPTLAWSHSRNVA